MPIGCAFGLGAKARLNVGWDVCAEHWLPGRTVGIPDQDFGDRLDVEAVLAQLCEVYPGEGFQTGEISGVAERGPQPQAGGRLVHRRLQSIAGRCRGSRPPGAV